jgi:hypothetical protein
MSFKRFVCFAVTLVIHNSMQQRIFIVPHSLSFLGVSHSKASGFQQSRPRIAPDNDSGCRLAMRSQPANAMFHVPGLAGKCL